MTLQISYNIYSTYCINIEVYNKASPVNLAKTTALYCVLWPSVYILDYIRINTDEPASSFSVRLPLDPIFILIVSVDIKNSHSMDENVWESWWCSM